MSEFFDKVVENVAHGGVAHPHGAGHVFEAAARFDEVEDELLFFLGETCQRRQIKFAAHFCAAFVTKQFAHFQGGIAARASQRQFFRCIHCLLIYWHKCKLYFYNIKIKLNKIYSAFLFIENRNARGRRAL